MIIVRVMRREYVQGCMRKVFIGSDEYFCEREREKKIIEKNGDGKIRITNCNARKY